MKRYSIRHGDRGYSTDIYEAPHGMWVRWQDAEELRKRVERLEGIVWKAYIDAKIDPTKGKTA